MKADNDNQPARIGPWLPTAELARAHGAKHFYTGAPCKYGHDAPRHTSNSTCLECTRIRVAKWMNDNPDKAAIMKAKVLEKQARDYAANPEKYADRSRRSRIKNIEKFRARERAYRLSHKEEQASRVRNRRARAKGSGGTHTAKDIANILNRQQYKCAECGVSVRKKTDRNVDHIMPIARGGSNGPENLQVLCKSCNQKKGSLHPLEWARRNGRLV